MKKQLLFFLFLLILGFSAFSQKEAANQLLLKNFRPVSVYAIPVTIPEKAKFPVIDMHSHPYATNEQELNNWVKTMDEMGITKTIILTGTTGAKFDSLADVYGKYPGRNSGADLITLVMTNRGLDLQLLKN
jgi:5,10-methylenetetrahydrofolate reductase